MFLLFNLALLEISAPKDGISSKSVLKHQSWKEWKQVKSDMGLGVVRNLDSGIPPLNSGGIRISSFSKARLKDNIK